MDLKERLIKEVSKETGYSEHLCRKLVNHQFSYIKVYMATHEVGEIHIPRIGKVVSTEGGVKYRKKKIEEFLKNKKENESNRD
jgi:hypothetical protein